MFFSAGLVRWPPLRRALFSLLETGLTYCLSCLRVRLMEARSRVSVGLGAVLVGLVWVVGFLRFAGPLPSCFPPSFGGYPFLGLCTPLCNIVDLRVFLLAICEYPWCRPSRVLGFGWFWFLGFGWLLGFGFGFGLVAGGYHGYSESFFAAVNRGLPRTCGCLTFTLRRTSLPPCQRAGLGLFAF